MWATIPNNGDAAVQFDQPTGQVHDRITDSAKALYAMEAGEEMWRSSMGGEPMGGDLTESEAEAMASRGQGLFRDSFS